MRKRKPYPYPQSLPCLSARVGGSLCEPGRVAAWLSRVALLIAVNLGSFCLAAEPGAGKLENYLVSLGFEPIPLRNEDYRFCAEGILAGRKYFFGVFTGVEVSELDNDAAPELKTLGNLHATLDDEVLGTLSDPTTVVMDKLTLARAQCLNQPVLRRPLRTTLGAVTLQGILGCDFLVRNHALLDCGARHLYIRAAAPSTNVLSALQTSLHRSGFGELPIEFKKWFSMDISVNEKPLHVILCTSSTMCLIDDAAAKPLELVAIKSGFPATDMLPHEFAGWGRDPSGVPRKLSFYKANLRMGPSQSSNACFVVTNLRTVAGQLGDNWQGWIGMDQLIAKAALIDCCSRKIWFPPAPAK